MSQQYRCELTSACPYIDDDSICCMSCPKKDDCYFVCKFYEDWVIKGVKCRYAIPIKEEGDMSVYRAVVFGFLPMISLKLEITPEDIDLILLVIMLFCLFLPLLGDDDD